MNSATNYYFNILQFKYETEQIWRNWKEVSFGVLNNKKENYYIVVNYYLSGNFNTQEYF